MLPSLELFQQGNAVTRWLFRLRVVYLREALQGTLEAVADHGHRRHAGIVDADGTARGRAHQVHQAGIAATPHIALHNTSVYAQYTLQVPNRQALQETLKAAGIPTVVHYPVPLNQQPAVADPNAVLPVGDAVARQVMSLPMHPYLKEADQNRIADQLRIALAAEIAA